MVWLILMAAVVAVGAFAFAWSRGRTVERTPDEVARFLRNFIEGTGGDMDWDAFESVPIADPDLERIRLEAAKAAPPNADMDRLRDLLRQAEELVKR